VAKERAFLEGLYGSEEKLQVGICLAENDLHIGMCGLHDISRIHRSAILGILIGERTLLGKGHGSEALRLLIDHAFRRLNLHRLELGVFHTNARALACYRKLGFVEEGRLRKNRFVEGEYVDEIVMGLLREEWKG